MIRLSPHTVARPSSFSERPSLVQVCGPEAGQHGGGENRRVKPKINRHEPSQLSVGPVCGDTRLCKTTCNVGGTTRGNVSIGADASAKST